LSTKPVRVKEGVGPSLNRERVIAAALEIIDTEGLDAFSIRGLAQNLGVYPTAIYWYVPSRNAVLAGVVAEVLNNVTPEQDDVWTEWLRALFRNFRRQVRRHPNVAPLIGAQLVSNSSIDFQMIDCILAKLEGAGFRGESLRHAYNTVITTMGSFVTHELAPRPSETAENWQEELRATIHSVDPDNYPTISRHLPHLENRAFIVRWQNGVDVPLDGSFEFFIDAVLRGLLQVSRESEAAEAGRAKH
jgi:AcrR family transcriptional regulator